MSARSSTANGGHGSKWIKPAKRLAIYLRDDFACVYCGASGRPRSAENPRGGALLSLDHLHPRELGGGNEAENLVTACASCNSARKATPLAEFVTLSAQALGCSAEELRRRIRNAQRRSWKLHLPAARELHTAPPGWLRSMRFLASRDMRDRIQCWAQVDATRASEEIPF